MLNDYYGTRVLVLGYNNSNNNNNNKTGMMARFMRKRSLFRTKSLNSRHREVTRLDLQPQPHSARNSVYLFNQVLGKGACQLGSMYLGAEATVGWFERLQRGGREQSKGRESLFGPR